MQFTQEIQRILVGTLLVFVFIAITVAYWGTIGADGLLGRGDNPRLFEALARINRGDILDRNNQLLVTTEYDEDNLALRRYLYPKMNSALGYYSLRYGVGGVEAAHDDILSGNDLESDLNTFFQENLLHNPQQGSDIRLTFDLETQHTIINAMGTQRGAVVVLSAQDGAVLGLASLPTYDPNTLDEQWEQLVESADDPFFNRVLQGNYQPGGTVQVLLATATVLEQIPLNTQFGDATSPIAVDDLRLSCNLQPANDTVTLAEAFLHGCPSPFAQLIEQIGIEQIETTFDLFGFNQDVTLADFAEEADTEFVSSDQDEQFQLDDALGQGSITVTPLQMASIMAAFINGGNAPQPYALNAVRLPGEDTWTPTRIARSSLAITTPEIARQVANLMRETASNGTVGAADDNLDIGGYAALAYSGDETQTWFIGFAQTGTREGVTVAVVIENSADLDLAAQIGGVALQAGVNALPSGEIR